MAQNWLDGDGLFRQYGTDKTTPEVAGEFKSYGNNRVVEVLVDISKLTTTAGILSYTEFFPAGSNVFIEKVEAVCETAIATITTFSVGLIQTDQSTIPSGYSAAFISAEVAATFDTAGKAVTYLAAGTHAGSLIGTFPASATGPYYLSGLITGAAGTGKIRVRIYYHGVGTIPN